MSFVDYRDVAEVAALALAGDDLVDGTIELAAGGMLTRTEIAAMISRHAGRTVLAEDVDPDVALGGMPAGAMRDGLTAMFADYTAYGYRGGNNLVLRTVLGRAPRTLDSYLGELAESAPTTSPNRVGAPASGGSAGGGRLNAVCQADACANAAGSIAAGSGEPMSRCWLLAAGCCEVKVLDHADDWSASPRLPERVTVAVPRGRAQPDWHMRCKGVRFVDFLFPNHPVVVSGAVTAGF